MMQFNQLRWREFISSVHRAATHWLPRASAARHDIATGGPHRRQLLQGFLATALSTAPGWHEDAVAGMLPLERGRFIELSEKLCAMSIDDASLADPIQNALADQYGDNDLRRISELLHSAALQDVDRLVASSGLHRLAKSIVSVWYSGTFGTGEKARVLAYEEALAWRATGYARAPGTCGEFGDWITAPPSATHRERRP